MRVLGVDGWRGGWIAAVVEDGAPTPARIGWLLAADPAQLLADPAVAIGVDIPIGLPDSGPRDCDRAARARLGRRGCTVFPAPVRVAMSAADHPAACRQARATGGPAPSRQCFHLFPAIRAWDALLTAADDDRVIEVHPEVSFAAMTGGPLPPKRTPAGITARRDALGGWQPAIAGALDRRPRGPGIDDALDALAVAWTVRRWLCGDAEVLPAQPPRDARGLPMRIVC